MNTTTTPTPSVSRRASKIIKEFNNNERGMYELAMQYMQGDHSELVRIQRAIDVHGRDAELTTRLREVMARNDRAGFLLQCWGLYVNTCWDTGMMTVKTLADN